MACGLLPKPKALRPSRATVQARKKWGFVAEGDRLLICYALLPCTVVLKHDLAAPDGMSLALCDCFAGSAAATLENTGASLEIRYCLQLPLRAWQYLQPLLA